MCYERRRAEACVDESAHHALELGSSFLFLQEQIKDIIIIRLCVHLLQYLLHVAL
jgi:hypothetical protein